MKKIIFKNIKCKFFFLKLKNKKILNEKFFF
jgi:hypothetical protein